ncbi:MAG: twin-arginine translocase subunit TatC, partial [Alphaproteobacteria bacterium]|nr:twin-arginine translocase subunit TatC [Alphaproteobacteria bacterium]
PPDVVSQLLLALPIIALYELSIFGAKILAPEPYDEPAN